MNGSGNLVIWLMGYLIGRFINITNYPIDYRFHRRLWSRKMR